MRTLARWILVFTALSSTTFAEGKRERMLKQWNREVEQIVLLTDLTPEMTKEFLKGAQPQIAVQCQRGTELPIKYLFSNGFLSIHYSPSLTFKVEKTFYMRHIGKKTRVSFDLKKWEKPSLDLLDTRLGISPDHSHFLIEVKENSSSTAN